MYDTMKKNEIIFQYIWKNSPGWFLVVILWLYVSIYLLGAHPSSTQSVNIDLAMYVLFRTHFIFEICCGHRIALVCSMCALSAEKERETIRFCQSWFQSALQQQQQKKQIKFFETWLFLRGNLPSAHMPSFVFRIAFFIFSVSPFLICMPG